MKLNHNKLPAAVFTFGLSLTAALMFVSFQYLVQGEQDSFNKQSKHMASMFEEKIENVRDEIRALTTTFYALDRINHDTLRIYSEYTFSRHQSILNMVFARPVKHPQRSRFVADKHAEGLISFRIHNIHNPSIITAVEPSYLPITQVEPFNVDNVNLLGANLFDAGDFFNVIAHAIKTGNDVSVITSVGDESKHLWVFKAIYSGYSGSSDPYFINHSNAMFSGIIGIKADMIALLHDNNVDSIKMKLIVRDKTTGSNASPVLYSDWQAPPSIWAGLSLTNQFSFPLSNQEIILQTAQTVPWFDRSFLLFFLCALIGLGFTSLMVYATRAMLESERRNSAILNAALDAIISIDEHGIIQAFNPAAERMFGYASHMIIGKNISKSILPEHQHVFGKQLEAIAKKANGEIFSVELNMVEVVAGKDRMFTAFLRDISIRKKAQSALARLATVVKQSFNAIIITNKEGIIEYVNPAFEKMSGFSSTEALGQRPSIVKSNEHPGQFYDDMWKTISAGKTWTKPFINRNKDGYIYHVEQTISPLEIDGTCVGYTSVQQDVTERNILQTQSEHTQRLESLGVLAGGIAHDFNNLLSVIMGNTGLVQSKLGLKNIASKELNHIQQASKSAATLCQQMLAYSGQGKFIIQPLNLSSIIMDTMQLLESSIAKLAKLDIQLDHNLCAIEADEGQIRQVIMNLVINASEAIGDEPGHIHITTAQLYLHNHDLSNLLGNKDLPTGDYIHLQIRDDGCGMDEEIKKRIFDPFFTTKFTGRGLGMSAILGIIRAHGAGLKMYSQPKQGTCFDLYFPASTATYDTAIADTSKQHEIKVHSTILVVDDDELLREIAQSILEEIGMSIIQAEDGITALALLQADLNDQQAIGLVLLDMTMPNMGGEACYKEISAMAPDLNVIICSGYAENEVRERFSKNSSNIDFLQKPYLPDQLIDKVQHLFSSNQHSPTI